MTRCGAVLFGLFCFASLAPAWGQAKYVPPPELSTVRPVAIQRGSEQPIVLTGTNLTDIKSVRFSVPGLTAEVGKVTGGRTVELKVRCAADAPVGIAEVRVVTTHGVSNCRYLYVDTLPVVQEKEPNTLFSQGQPIEQLPVGITGTITGADRDFFRFYAKAGQKLVFQALGRPFLPFLRIDDRIGWFDTYLELYGGTGRQLASADDFRMRPDAVLVYEFSTDGEYVLCVRDAAYRGRNEFAYYLRVGELPFVTDWFPLGGKGGTTVEFTFSSVSAPEKASIALPAVTRRLAFWRYYLPVGQNTTNEIELAVDGLDGVAETEPNNEAAKATKITPPIAVNGRVDRPGDEDWFAFEAKKGQKLALEVVARRVGSALDSVLEIYRDGRRVAGNDDAVARVGYLQRSDSRIVYTVPADGVYHIRVRDLARLGGPEFAYRLLVYPAQPDFEGYLVPSDPFITNPRLTIALTVARALPVGGTVAVPVRVARIDGFNGAIELRVDDLPKGIEARTAPIAPGATQGILTLTADEELEPGTVIPLKVRLSADIGGKKVDRIAIPLESHSYIADQRQEFPVAEAVTAIAQAYPLTLSVEPLQVTVKKGQSARVKVRWNRPEGGDQSLKIEALNLPKQVTVQVANVAVDKKEADVEIKVGGGVAPGTYGLALVGTAKIDKSDVRAYAPLVLVKVEP